MDAFGGGDAFTLKGWQKYFILQARFPFSPAFPLAGHQLPASPNKNRAGKFSHFA
jgi:hypothetical protein